MISPAAIRRSRRTSPLRKSRRRPGPAQRASGPLPWKGSPPSGRRQPLVWGAGRSDQAPRSRSARGRCIAHERCADSTLGTFSSTVRSMETSCSPGAGGRRHRQERLHGPRGRLHGPSVVPGEDDHTRVVPPGAGWRGHGIKDVRKWGARAGPILADDASAPHPSLPLGLMMPPPHGTWVMCSSAKEEAGMMAQLVVCGRDRRIYVVARLAIRREARRAVVGDSCVAAAPV